MDDHDGNPIVADLVMLDVTLANLRAFAAGGELDAAASSNRSSLLKRARAGELDAIEIDAVVFTQTDGKPNRKGLRIAPSALHAFASSFSGKPMLVDHRSYAVSARVGTILSSTLEQSGGTSSIRQRLRVVKADAITSVLDGTLDRFSIGWGRGDGGVICSIHRTPAMESCDCWPLDQLTVDGEKRTVEFEFTSPSGDETSGVNVPAATGTKITDVRAALAAALSLPPHESRIRMSFMQLAAALGLSALTANDEATAVAAVNKLRGQLTGAQASLETMETRATTAETSLAAATTELTALRTSAVDAEIDRCYREGRLAAKRDAAGKRLPSVAEPGIRKLAATMPLKDFAAYVDELPQIIPVNQRPTSELHADKIARTEFDAPTALAAPVLDSVAAQLGLDPKRVASNVATLAANRSGAHGMRATIADGLDHPEPARSTRSKEG